MLFTMNKSYDTLTRVSNMNGRKESADSTMTLVDQKALITGELARIGGKQGKTFEALDESGFTVLDSPAIAEILSRVEAGQSAGLVIAYGDRLARNSWKLGGFYSRMEKAGGEIHDASMPGIDYRTPEGRQLTMMRGVSSEGVYFAAKRRGDSIADAVVARGVANAVPYGYVRNEQAGVKSDPSRDAKALVPHPEHAAVVRKIFELRLAETRISDVVRTLNEAGVPSPRGKRWTWATVETIVQNETYTGVVKLGARRKESAHEALVSRGNWLRVQSTRGVSHSGLYRVGLAGGLLSCSGCGAPLSVTGPAKNLAYACKSKRADGPCPRPVAISKRAADAFVLSEIEQALNSRGGELLASTRQLEEARQALEVAQGELAGWLEHAGILSAEELQIALRPRRAAVARAQEAYEKALAESGEAADLPESGSMFRSASEQDRRRTARSLIESIVVSPPIAGGKPEDRLAVAWR
jgi:DNA invertase Pin-like site-specific DNA recombinase